MPVSDLPSYEDVLDVILSHMHPAETERAGVINTPGRTLAEDVTSAETGDVLLRKGTVIGASEMGLLAELGVPGVMVSRRPKVSIITTGDEFVDLMEDLTPGKRRNINRYSLAGGVFSSGCEIGRLLHAEDSEESLRRSLHAVRASDLVVIADGVDGKSETVRRALGTSDILVDGAAMNPGGSVVFALNGGKPAIVLPEDGCSAALVFELVVKPALSAILGREEVRPRFAQATAKTSFAGDPILRKFVPAVAALGSGKLTVSSVAGESMSNMSRSNCIAVVPEGVVSVKAGEEISVVLTRPMQLS